MRAHRRDCTRESCERNSPLSGRVLLLPLAYCILCVHSFCCLCSHIYHIIRQDDVLSSDSTALHRSTVLDSPYGCASLKKVASPSPSSSSPSPSLFSYCGNYSRAEYAAIVSYRSVVVGRTAVAPIVIATDCSRVPCRSLGGAL